MKSRKLLTPRSEDKEPRLSREWQRELQRRVRESRNPVRYMLVSEFSRSFILYYNVSDDVFVMNALDRGTIFKRREAAERVSKLLSSGVRIVKFTIKGDKLKRISPFRGRSLSRSNRRTRNTVA
jgi:hypothetical protein